MATTAVDARGNQWTRESVIKLLKGCSCDQCRNWSEAGENRPRHRPGCQCDECTRWFENRRKARPCRQGLVSNAAVEKALLRLYERQTRDEQDTEHTKQENDRGFGQSTARIFTSFAKQILENKYKNPIGLRLTARQFARCRKLWGKTDIPTIGTYANQLLEEIASKSEQTVPTQTITVVPLKGTPGFPFRWQVTGKPAEVAAWFDELCRQYPTNPYGTTKMAQETTNEDGTITAIFGRYGTCD